MNTYKNAFPNRSRMTAIPPIDAAMPAGWETATFGLG
jgi:hypothetical protein